MRSVVLIGPYGVGKSTIGRLLAAARGQQAYSLDEHAWTYYREVGLTEESAASLGDFDDPQWQLYHSRAVKRFLQDHQDEQCVMDLGAGHALYDGAYLSDVQAALAPYDVVLLMPSPDPAISLRDLEERNNAHHLKRRQPHARWNAFFIDHPASYSLATHIVYTKDRTPEQTCQELLEIIADNKN